MPLICRSHDLQMSGIAASPAAIWTKIGNYVPEYNFQFSSLLSPCCQECVSRVCFLLVFYVDRFCGQMPLRGKASWKDTTSPPSAGRCCGSWCQLVAKTESTAEEGGGCAGQRSPKVCEFFHKYLSHMLAGRLYQPQKERAFKRKLTPITTFPV